MKFPKDIEKATFRLKELKKVHLPITNFECPGQIYCQERNELKYSPSAFPDNNSGLGLFFCTKVEIVCTKKVKKVCTKNKEVCTEKKENSSMFLERYAGVFFFCNII